MSSAETSATGPDLTQGVGAGDLADGQMLAGHVGDEAVLLARRGSEFLAISATCIRTISPIPWRRRACISCGA